MKAATAGSARAAPASAAAGIMMAAAVAPARDVPARAPMTRVVAARIVTMAVTAAAIAITVASAKHTRRPGQGAGNISQLRPRWLWLDNGGERQSQNPHEQSPE
jgi:hypothetical protein